MIQNNEINTPHEIFNWKVHPFYIMTFSSILSVIFYVVFIIVGLHLPINDEDNYYPSVSSIIAFSKTMTISFTFIVYIHSYSLYSYLVILTDYLGKNSISFFITTTVCILYVLCLIIVTYLPVSADELKHNVFAIGAFIFAGLSVYLHKNSFIVYSSRGYPVCDKKEGLLVITEVIVLIIIAVMGGLFWFQDKIWAEYVFIFFILIDKQFKTMILIGTKLMNIEGSYMSYAYFSPPNPTYRVVNTGIDFDF